MVFNEMKLKSFSSLLASPAHEIEENWDSVLSGALQVCPI